MQCGEAKMLVGGLSSPGKMPGKAFGFSATKCITGSKLRKVPGSVCSDCYAMKGLYASMPNVKVAHRRRYRALSKALSNATERERYVRAMTTLIRGQRWFRWHDSGDLQSVEHLRLIADICRATPDTRHWLPTREYHMVAAYTASGDTVPDNLTIRLSAHMVNETIPAAGIPDGMTASAVWRDLDAAPGHRCPSRHQDNACGDCRACWSRDVPLVTYEKH